MHGIALSQILKGLCSPLKKVVASCTRRPCLAFRVEMQLAFFCHSDNVLVDAFFGYQPTKNSGNHAQ